VIAASIDISCDYVIGSDLLAVLGLGEIELVGGPDNDGPLRFDDIDAHHPKGDDGTLVGVITGVSDSLGGGKTTRLSSRHPSRNGTKSVVS